jgi:hypothetical protein
MQRTGSGRSWQQSEVLAHGEKNGTQGGVVVVVVLVVVEVVVLVVPGGGVVPGDGVVVPGDGGVVVPGVLGQSLADCTRKLKGCWARTSCRAFLPILPCLGS